MKKALMCYPDYYDVPTELETNRWMNSKNRPAPDLATAQWFGLRDNLIKHGVHVSHIEPESDLFDMTFVANAGLPFKNKFILSNFYHEHRRPEKRFHKVYFGEYFGEDNVFSLHEEALFEGQGDAFFVNSKTLLIGYGERTNWKGVQEVAGIICALDSSVSVVPLQLKHHGQYLPGEKNFYHLDTCLFHSPTHEMFIFYPDAFARPDSVCNELNHFGSVVDIKKEEAETFICNSREVDEETIFTPQIGPGPCEMMRHAAGYKNIVQHDMSEFLKSGAAVRCLTLELG